MSILRCTFTAVNFARNHILTNCQHISSKSGTGKGRVIKSAVSRRKSADSIIPLAANADPWVEVLDKASGQVYYWNQTTNETTSIGAPRPFAGQSAVVPQQQQEQPQSMMSGLGGVVAQGFAFGVGSSIAHNVVGSMFGGSSSSSSDSGGDSGGGDSGFEI